MKLVSRYSIIGILVLAVSIVLGGFNLIENDFNRRLAEQSAKLDHYAAKIVSSADPLSTALLAAEDLGVPVTVVFLTSDGVMTPMVESSVTFKAVPSVSLRNSTEKAAKFVAAKTSYLFRTVDLSDGDYILVAEDVQSFISDRADSRNSLAITAMLVTLLGGALITLLVRLNFRSVVKTLRTSAEHERETRQAMQNFMGDASHELRTPLTVIKGYAEMLAGEIEIDSQARKKAFSRIVEQVDRMDETIASLLQLAEVGSVSANSFTTLDLSELVDNAADDLEAIDHNRVVTRDIAPALQVMGSPELLRSLLDNAIGNIHRHTASTAAARITLAKSGKQALLVIEDAGPGLPEGAYAQGIQGFQRFDKARSRNDGGTGLGMAIMSSIVEALDGRLTLGKSELGGLKIEIWLPIN